MKKVLIFLTFFVIRNIINGYILVYLLIFFCMIKLIVFDIRKTIAYRDLPENSSKTIRKTIKSQIPYPKFVKIFEKSLQTKKWDSKFDAYANLCKNINLPVTDENVNLLMSMRDAAESKTKEYEHTIPMLKQLKDS